MTMVVMGQWHDVRPADLEKFNDKWIFEDPESENDPNLHWIEHPLHDRKVALHHQSGWAIGLAVPQGQDEWGEGEFTIMREELSLNRVTHALDFVPDPGDPSYLSPELKDWLALHQIPFKEIVPLVEKSLPMYSYSHVSVRYTAEGRESVIDGRELADLSQPEGPSASGLDRHLDWSDIIQLITY